MQTKTTGFILIKVVIAITLLAIVLSVSLQMIGASAKAIRDNRQKTTATFLLQQCLEWTRNLRDTAWKQSLPWDCGLQTDINIPNGSYTFKSEPGPTGICNNGSFATLKQLGYTLSPTTEPEAIELDSIYKRLLTISGIHGEERTKTLLATCRIDWPSNGGGDESLEISHILTDWKKK